MHEKIMRFPSDELYDSKLVAADGVKARLLTELPYEVDETEDTIEPLIFLDTQGGDFPEKSEEEEVDKKAGRGMMGESKSNEMEAALVKQHVQSLVDAGVKPDDIAVITPYNAQVTYKNSSRAACTDA
jgi:DNA polymerase alpha-associated DNA helicase A